MEYSINWKNDLESVINETTTSEKSALLYYMNPPCPSCQEMENTTFRNEGVIRFVNDHLIPLRAEAPKSEFVANKYNLKRAPTCLILDSKGIEHHRTVGYFDADDFIASMLLGISKKQYDLGLYDQALNYLDRLFKKFPQNDVIPEAIYLRGGTRFKSTSERFHLRQAYEKLRREYPADPWKKRAYPYRVIKNNAET
jgi:tetratricopeptide (TPR) repeat protein